jgi:hypothetical protein
LRDAEFVPIEDHAPCLWPSVSNGDPSSLPYEAQPEIEDPATIPRDFSNDDYLKKDDSDAKDPVIILRSFLWNNDPAAILSDLFEDHSLKKDNSDAEDPDIIPRSFLWNEDADALKAKSSGTRRNSVPVPNVSSPPVMECGSTSRPQRAPVPPSQAPGSLDDFIALTLLKHKAPGEHFSAWFGTQNEFTVSRNGVSGYAVKDSKSRECLLKPDKPPRRDLENK